MREVFDGLRHIVRRLGGVWFSLQQVGHFAMQMIGGKASSAWLGLG